MNDKVSTHSPAARFVPKGVVLRLAFMLVCFVLIGGGAAILHARAAMTPEARANPPITVATEVIEAATAYAVEERYVGRVEPTRHTQLGFELSGLVTRVAVDEGDVVRAGQVIAQLDTDKLLASRDALQAERKEILARRDLARATLKRQRELRSEGWQTEQRYDEARYSLSQFSAAIERLDAAIESTDIDIDKSSIFAPYDGVIGARFIDEGAVVSPGMPIADILEIGQLQARIGIPASVSDEISAGSRHSVDVAGRRLSAHVVSMRPDLNTGTRTVTIILSFEQDVAIPSGEIVELVLQRDIDETGYWLPITSLNEGQKGIWTVMTVMYGEGEAAVQREAVEIIHLDGTKAYVRGTLQDGDRIIVNGSNRIVPGQRVLVEGGAD